MPNNTDKHSSHLSGEYFVAAELYRRVARFWRWASRCSCGFILIPLLVDLCGCYRVRLWEIIADKLSKAGWSWGCVSAIDSNGRTSWIAYAHRDDGKCFVVRRWKADGVC
jgi:hypothetical protein